MKKFLLPFLLGALIFTPHAGAQRASSSGGQVAAPIDIARYIGLRHNSTVPANLKDVGGALVSEVGDAREYGLSEIHKGRVRMIWFERLTHRDETGRPNWEVKDVLVLPALRKNQVLVYAMCYSGKQPDKEIVAIADYQDAEFLTRLHRAWRANRKTEKFEPISPKGIKCTNEGYGV